jgi:hypothetical protein
LALLKVTFSVSAPLVPVTATALLLVVRVTPQLPSVPVSWVASSAIARPQLPFGVAPPNALAKVAEPVGAG